MEALILAIVVIIALYPVCLVISILQLLRKLLLKKLSEK